MSRRPVLGKLASENVSRRLVLQAAATATAVGVVGLGSPAAAAGIPTHTVNGWEVIPSRPDSRLATIAIAGRSAIVRAGDVATLLQYVALQFNARVEPILTFSGHRTYAENLGSGGYPTSNHMSGTAVDINGYKHPYKAPHGFTPGQVDEIDRICWETSGAVYWGGYFGNGLIDGMHFEIKNGKTADDVAAAAAALGTVIGAPPTTPPTIEDDDMALALITTSGTTAWWAYDGMSKRMLAPGEPQLLVDLGLIRPETLAAGVKWLAPDLVNAIPNQ